MWSLIEINHRWEPFESFYDATADEESAAHFVFQFWNAQGIIQPLKVESATDIPTAGHYAKSRAIWLEKPLTEDTQT